MTPEALDFQAECEQIRSLIQRHDDSVFEKVTRFKNWTVGDIMAHLHLWNIAADLSFVDFPAFQNLTKRAMAELNSGQTHQTFQRAYFEGTSDAEIFESWVNYFPAMAARFNAALPDMRVKWVGPDMSLRSSIVARQMEHWAHAQAIFDILGLERLNFDRLKNVAHIGVTTFSWSFRVRGQTPPKPKPFVKLTAPSGDIWRWNDVQDSNRIEGAAESFCQVVTQCRNVMDTDLVVIGPIANEWMSNAQCFAGVAEKPPLKGERRKS